MDLSDEKSQLRKTFRNEREQWLKNQQPVRVAAQLAKNLSIVLMEYQGGLWGSYRPKKVEANPLMVAATHKQYAWCFPKVEGDSIKFYMCSEETQFSTSSLGIDEPIPESAVPVEPEAMLGMFIPLTAFDRFGNRLGSGKGHYDRILKDFKGLAVGVGFAMQMSKEELPVEAHDRVLDVVVTEEFILRPRKRKAGRSVKRGK